MHNASFVHRLQTTVQSNFTDLQTTVKKYLANVKKKSPRFQTISIKVWPKYDPPHLTKENGGKVPLPLTIRPPKIM